MDYETLRAIIANGEFDKLIGEIENDFFDCKGSLYIFDDAKGKYEFVKDITSFANAKGGFILIGIETDKNPTHLGDEVTRIRPFEQKRINIQQYLDIIREWIYPNPQGIDIKWIKSKKGSGTGIGVIEIPEQALSNRPFLIAKTIIDERKAEVVFGYVERELDRSRHLTVGDLRRLLQRGVSYEESINQRLKNIEAAVFQGIGNNNLTANMLEEVSKRISNTLEYRGLSEKRTIILSAFTSENIELKTIFKSMEDSNSIRRKLAFPPTTLRPNGWSIETRDEPQIIEGKFIRASKGDVEVVDLYRDGTLIFVGLADQNFLCWGPTYQDQLRFKPIALVELIYNFMRFYCEIVIDDFESKPKRFSVRVDLQQMLLDGVKSKLGPDGLNSASQRHDLGTREAPSEHFSKTKDFPTSSCNASRVAFLVLKEIYLWFGIEEDGIPYTKLENSVRMVDPVAIRNPNK